MKILIKTIFILVCSVNILFSQTTDSAVLYQEAINTVDGDKASKIYDKIIQSNSKSDYYWLSVLKKAELNYAIGSYITASVLFREFNVDAPGYLVTEDTKDLFFKSLAAAGQTDSLRIYQKKLNRSVSSKQSKNIINKNKVWFIQFGAYSKKDSAEILKESLMEDGLRDIQVSQVMNRGKMIYYVRSSNVKSYSSIKKQADKLKKKDIDFIISGY
ncbi:MAG: SPOR domain-containing protein [Candidatus Marinimicrobia bacterium]|nr:SPOR domain-containing protein [Candidatus Neomarinimicrobiota bacterium]MDG2188550.1 SPOR domain-containing protein [Candidatus Neomarinimicrobiota bacterium]